ncbi:glycosyltransferase [Arthrobacter sp. H35-D1]|uniref:glycosyltransferase n=1 Tax=Arthrobacter sp. H35-D1 TaxID=3046202 RepID=UPI0024B9EAFD|nr:glycosyltransferase [Arthrobacter sp. H35-D1]MDJ0312315.1 glycosyltransferase [Arthrobacter sp. H35-D1]
METIIYQAGSSWDSVTGTDKNLAVALGRGGQVLWVDPPISMLRTTRLQQITRVTELLDEVGEGIVRLRTIGPPGVTRPVLRQWTKVAYHHYIRSAIKFLGLDVDGTICASPIMTFAKNVGGNRLLFVTDDWISGSDLMGFSESNIRRVLRTNATKATVVAAVTGHLGQDLSEVLGGKVVEVVPNGCNMGEPIYVQDPGFAKAALVGQLNERLDFEVLKAVADTGIHIQVAGPKTAKSVKGLLQLDSFLSRPNVHWKGVLNSEGVAALLADSNVGLTPYTDTRFNRSSFPLKTLEYVAAGVPVVATDLPASKFEPAAKVRVASNAAEFAQTVTEVSARWPTDAEREEQAKQARAHTWKDRAELLRNLLAR